LTDLWTTRDAQRLWPPEVLLNLGRRLICARYLAGHPIRSLRLCEDIAYNVRRVHGSRHSATLETCNLLAQLYTSTGQYYQKTAAQDKHAVELATEYYKKAIFVHEDLLRWLASDQSGVEDDEDEEDDIAAGILAEHGIHVQGGEKQGETNQTLIDKAAMAKTHLRLLKFAFQRLGSWPKPYAVYERLNANVFKAFNLTGVEGVEKWTAKGFGGGKAESTEGSFSGVSHWEILN
jgi:hypothetical protein